MKDPKIGGRLFVDGITRTVYRDARGQYVKDEYGEKLWRLAVRNADKPVVVQLEKRK